MRRNCKEQVLLFVNNQSICQEINYNHFGNLGQHFKPEIEPLNYNSLILFVGTVAQFQSKQYAELNFVVLKQNIVLPRDKADMSVLYTSKEEVVSLLWEHFIAAQQYIIQNHLVLDPKGEARRHYFLMPQQDIVTEVDSFTPRHFLLAIVSDVVPKLETSVGPLKAFILDPTHDATSLSSPTLSPSHFKELTISCANTTGPGISPRVGSCVLFHNMEQMLHYTLSIT